MKVKNLIQLLQEYPEDADVLIVEHGFSMGAVQSYVRLLIAEDVSFQNKINEKDLIFPEGDIAEGVLIGQIPQYVQNI